VLFDISCSATLAKPDFTTYKTHWVMGPDCGEGRHSQTQGKGKAVERGSAGHVERGMGSDRGEKHKKEGGVWISTVQRVMLLALTSSKSYLFEPKLSTICEPFPRARGEREGYDASKIPEVRVQKATWQ
jgi:hypothetical protein